MHRSFGRREVYFLFDTLILFRGHSRGDGGLLHEKDSSRWWVSLQNFLVLSLLNIKIHCIATLRIFEIYFKISKSEVINIFWRHNRRITRKNLVENSNSPVIPWMNFCIRCLDPMNEFLHYVSCSYEWISALRVLIPWMNFCIRCLLLGVDAELGKSLYNKIAELLNVIIVAFTMWCPMQSGSPILNGDETT